MDIYDLQIHSNFPNLVPTGFKLTSPPTHEYNCIAWAAEDNTRWWWPDPMNIYYWPDEIPRQCTIESFIKLFEMLGYTTCDNAEKEENYIKIAIYKNSMGIPTHAARQLESGLWTSKLGPNKDIEHKLEGLTSDVYGEAVVIMKRLVEPVS